MDGLIVLLIIIGVISSISKSNKKKKKKTAAKPAPPRADAPAAAKVPFSREEWNQYLKENGIPVAKEKVAASIKEVARAAEELPRADADSAAKAAAKKIAKARRKAAQETAAPTPKPARTAMHAAGSIALDPSRDIEGETEAEHTEHQRKAVEAEAHHRSSVEAQEVLRDMNLRTLRAAVVMKEVLDKPVALRPRRRY